jgi:predicted nucleic acid-binding protein
MRNKVTMSVVYRNRPTSIRDLLGLDQIGNNQVSKPKFREIIKLRIQYQNEKPVFKCLDSSMLIQKLLSGQKRKLLNLKLEMIKMSSERILQELQRKQEMAKLADGAPKSVEENVYEKDDGSA